MHYVTCGPITGHYSLSADVGGVIIDVITGGCDTEILRCFSFATNEIIALTGIILGVMIDQRKNISDKL